MARPFRMILTIVAATFVAAISHAGEAAPSPRDTYALHSAGDPELERIRWRGDFHRTGVSEGYVSDVAPLRSSRPPDRPLWLTVRGEFQADPSSKIHAIVDIGSQTLRVTGPGIDETWPVSTGRSGHATPRGEFYGVQWFSPNHKSSLYNDAPMPWAVFFNGNIAFHGTTSTSRLGSPASHGCIRLSNANARQLYEALHAAGAGSLVVSVR